MRPRPVPGFRGYLALLLVAAVVADMAVVGSTILALRVAQLSRESRLSADEASLALSRRTEQLLDSISGKLGVIASAAALMGPRELELLVARAAAESSDISSAYVLDSRGIALAVGLAGGREARRRELAGGDFSNNPLFRAAEAEGDIVWSDKYLSGVSGGTTVGVGTRRGGRVAIAEIPLDYILGTLRLAAGAGQLAVMIVDRRGEVVADSGGFFSPGVDNLFGLPAVREALRGVGPGGVGFLGGRKFHLAAARSELLGWTFIARVPYGMANDLIRTTVLEVLAILAGTLLLGIVLAPLWSRSLTAAVGALAAQARAVAGCRYGEATPAQRIREFGELSAILSEMEAAIREREAEYGSLNAELEERVVKRTRDLEKVNVELQATNESLRMTQAELVRAEKLAALGKLVAGVAHELNTPIGNGLMAVSALKAERGVLAGALASGLSRSALDAFLESAAAGLDIAERNLERAARLVSSFKQVAVDQASSQRRAFDLAEVVDEVLLTLQPSIKRKPYRIESSVPRGLLMDGYPGVLGQILAILVNNAVIHAFEGREGGLVRVGAAEDKPGLIRFTVEDDGVGIPEEHRGRIFEPFFTTMTGRGGAGLGLSIAHNMAKDVLGGSLDFVSEAGKGTLFVLRIPTLAPKLRVPERY